MPAKSEEWSGIVNLGLTLGFVFLAACLMVAVYAGYQWIDMQGWVPHNRQCAVVFPRGGWEQGEYKECSVIEPDENTTYVNCAFDLTYSEGTTRTMDVRLWGALSPKISMFSCQRTDEGVTCHLKELNIEDKATK